VGREPERGAFSAYPSSVLSPLMVRRERKKFFGDSDLGDNPNLAPTPSSLAS